MKEPGVEKPTLVTGGAEGEVQEVVSRGVEAVYVHEGNQEKVLLCDEGDSAAAEKRISIRADLPVSIALQYAEGVQVENRFISLYQIESDNAKTLTWSWCSD